jgi:hypothetical protein
MPENEDPIDNIELFTGSKVEFSKPLLVMESIRICVKNRSKPMIPGYTTEKTDRFGNIYRETIPDARKEWISSVIALRKLLSPESKKDNQFLEVEEEIMETKEKLFETYSYRPYSWKVVTDKDDPYKNKKRVFYLDPNTPKFMPEPGSVIEIPREGKLVPEKGAWDPHISSYIEGVVSCYDDLFAELNDLIERAGYFKKRTVTE